MITPDPDSVSQDGQVDRIADRALAQGRSIALVESLTSGRVAALLGAGRRRRRGDRWLRELADALTG